MWNGASWMEEGVKGGRLRGWRCIGPLLLLPLALPPLLLAQRFSIRCAPRIVGLRHVRVSITRAGDLGLARVILGAPPLRVDGVQLQQVSARAGRLFLRHRYCMRLLQSDRCRARASSAVAKSPEALQTKRTRRHPVSRRQGVYYGRMGVLRRQTFGQKWLKECASVSRVCVAAART